MSKLEKVAFTIDLILIAAIIILVSAIVTAIITQVNIDLTCIYP